MKPLQQDLRHIAIIDLRDADLFKTQHIRGSLSVCQNAKNLIESLSHSIAKAVSNEEKYKSKPIRRIVFVHEDPSQITEQASTIRDLQASIKIEDSKLYFLKTPLRDFFNKYPFICLTEENISNYHEMQSVNDEQKQKLLSDHQEKVLYSYSKFPQELLENQLFLGSIINSNSQRQLKDLGIKTLIDLTFHENEEKVSEWKLNEFKYIQLPIPTELQVSIEFQSINETIDTAIQQGPTMLFCQVEIIIFNNLKDGCTITSGIAVAFLMYLKGLRYDFASLKVMQLRGTTQINKTLYTQLMLYNPQIKGQLQQKGV